MLVQVQLWTMNEDYEGEVGELELVLDASNLFCRATPPSGEFFNARLPVVSAGPPRPAKTICETFPSHIT